MKTNVITCDSDLIRGFQFGNDASFGVLWNRYRSRLRGFVRRHVDYNDVDDILQETSVKVFSSLREHRYKDDGRFFSWVAKIAANCVKDYYRSRKKICSFTDSEHALDYFNESSQVAEVCDNVESEIIKDEEKKRLGLMVQMLPEKVQQVAIMRCFNDMKFEEIAEETNVSINTALGRMHSARVYLRQYMRCGTRICI
ncbi:MAG: sigma-70 family RNA polymerase sigma factor [Marinilabiliaceae bacterium]|jgi:RNA polymerase sigma-70 factor (ECF subfamily)|nr:sigma-70 family RNA polymerase sigma factor [Bacteroidales bacterium]MCR5697065.1 sigma-70 family RNA polymerase sigma factor [Marinilabiliaceae bacterium]